MVVSVSRRCDIPRYQFKWFMNRINEGYVVAVNPFNANQQKRIPLLPLKEGMDSSEGVDLIVFWTRNPRNILNNADELERRGLRFYVMTTVTGYPIELEPGMIRTGKAIAAMKDLAQKTGPDRVIWRYDPVILSNLTDGDFHRKNFASLAQQLSGSVRRVIISIYDEYPKTKQRFDRLEKFGTLKLLDNTCPAELLADMAHMAGEAGMEIQSCASKEDFSAYGIKGGACIDGELIKKLWGIELSGKDKNQRPCCLCGKSVDIGAYGLCAAHCTYCYAWS